MNDSLPDIYKSFLSDSALANTINRTKTSGFESVSVDGLNFTLSPGSDSMDPFNEEFNCSVILDEIASYTMPNQIAVPLVYCLICLVGLVGNGLVIFVIVGSKEMTKSVANIYILNLAAADTLLLLALPFSATQRALLAWPFGVGMCKIMESVKYLSYFASIFFLTAMSVDRYYAVVHVVRASRYRTNKNTFLVCLLVWVLSFVMIIPLLIYTKLHGEMCALVFDNNEAPKKNALTVYDEEYSLEDLCNEYYFPGPEENYHYEDTGEISGSHEDIIAQMLSSANGNDVLLTCKHPESQHFHVFIIITFVLGYFLPFGVISLSYAFILAKLLQPSESRSRSRQADRTRRKVTRMVIALVVAFFICWTPFYVWHVVMIKGINLSWVTCGTIRDFTFCLGFANSCLNPLLYTFLGQNFQERLRRSISMSIRPFTFSTFSRYTSNTLSRADTGLQTKRMEATNTEPGGDAAPRVTQAPSQVPEEEQPCIKSDANANHEMKKL